MLKLINIKKDYITPSLTVNALKGLSINFRKSEFVSVLGPSGCGKTTLLNIIGGLDKYTSGNLYISGKSTKEFSDRDWDVYRNHRVGFVFQSYNLIPHQTILKNVELALTIAGMNKEERVKKAKEALIKVGLEKEIYKRPNQLSGGQSQRVAIARALVNDPEILLADEPTGALDTETSKQIMDLIKNIAKERLVIMVTHNPELADQYSTRIIRLLDGELLSDSMPFSDEEELKETLAVIERQKAEQAEQKAQESGKKVKKDKKERAKMSFFTALKLSLNNLFSKKARTLMISIAGSIGIIGVSLVLSFSYGVKSYIKQMQNDMLSGNPIMIEESSLNISAMMQQGNMTARDLEWEEGKVNINSTMAQLVERSENMNNIMQSNEITQEYVDYVLSLPKDQAAAVFLSYGLDLSNNIYTSFTPAVDKPSFNSSTGVLNDGNGTEKTMSLATIKAIYASLLSHSNYADYASYINTLENSFHQITENDDYILNQYELLEGGRYAKEANEIMLVLSKNSNGYHWMSDMLLAQLGFYSQNEFMNMVFKATQNIENKSQDYIPQMDKTAFSYQDFIDKEFVYYPNSVAFKTATHTTPIPGFGSGTMIPQLDAVDMSAFHHTAFQDDMSTQDKQQGIPLRIVGILEPKDDLAYGSLNSGFFYTEALREEIFRIETQGESEIVKSLTQKGSFSSNIAKYSEQSDTKIMTGVVFDYNYIYPYDGDITPKLAYSTVGKASAFSGMASMFGGMMGDSGGDMSQIMEALNAKTLSLRDLTGRRVDRASLELESFVKEYPHWTDDAINLVNNNNVNDLEYQYDEVKKIHTISAKVNAGGTYSTKINLAAKGSIIDWECDCGSSSVCVHILATAYAYMMHADRAGFNLNSFVMQNSDKAAGAAMLIAQNKISGFTSEFDGTLHSFSANVDDGGTIRPVELVLERSGKIKEYHCDCSASNDDPCVHVVAFAMFCIAELSSSPTGFVMNPIIFNQTIANSIAVYPVNFDTKDAVLEYLERWNQPGEFSYINHQGQTITVLDGRANVEPLDMIGLIIGLINSLVQMVTIALTAFTSLSLVVSTVMIGIITYVSVVERIKEIGVIRSLGGRKRDVANLFTAETVILGLSSGLIGVLITYIGSFIINLIVKPLIGMSIAVFPLHYAAIMITISIALTFISGLFPSSAAARKDPVVALRTE